MEKYIGQDIKDVNLRKIFLSDNADGNLIEVRPATADEMQGNLFKLVRKTDTDNNRKQAIAN